MRVSAKNKPIVDSAINHVRCGARPLYVIAKEIRAAWRKPYFGAVPYLDAMGDLDAMRDMYGEDSAVSIVRYFLANATTWRGLVAVYIKAELHEMIRLHEKGELR